MTNLMKYGALVISMILLSACGTTGETQMFVLDLETSEASAIVADLGVDTVDFDDNESHLKAVNVQAWGKFGAEDLRNIEYSLLHTLSSNLPDNAYSLDKKYDIHLYIRRYLVTTSNTGGGVLATVAWAATDVHGKLVYDEQFYAWGSGHLVTTIGMIKDSVHERIVERIATTALILASGRDPGVAAPVVVENTATSREDAISQLPKSFVSLGHLGLSSVPIRAVQTVGAFVPSDSTGEPWKQPPLSERFDWPVYLKSLQDSYESNLEETRQATEALARSDTYVQLSSTPMVEMVEQSIPATAGLEKSIATTYRSIWSGNIRGADNFEIVIEGDKITGFSETMQFEIDGVLAQDTIKFIWYGRSNKGKGELTIDAQGNMAGEFKGDSWGKGKWVLIRADDPVAYLSTDKKAAPTLTPYPGFWGDFWAGVGLGTLKVMGCLLSAGVACR